jgi:DNA adenine methylase
LKWAGNKYRIIDQILAVLPPGQRLIEPFVGSGAVFLNTDYSEYLLTDANDDLINLFEHVQREGDAFVVYAEKWFRPKYNDRDAFYELRARFNKTRSKRFKAALFLYLNKHGYNGLCRYNQKGRFNVPFGRYKKPYFPAAEMRYFNQKAQHASIAVADFRDTMRQARPGDVIYCDPPYVPLSATANFTSYSTNGFGVADQIALADEANRLGQSGVTVVISNHDTPFTESVYAGASLTRFPVQRYISCDGANRNSADELLAVFKPV